MWLLLDLLILEIYRLLLMEASYGSSNSTFPILIHSTQLGHNLGVNQ